MTSKIQSQNNDNRNLTDEELNAITGGQKTMTASMRFGDQELTIAVSAHCICTFWF